MAGQTSTCERSPGPELSGTEHTDSTDQADSPTKSPSEMPTRKNKRKLSEPRRRSDFSMKRLCPNSPGSVSDNSVTSDVSDRGQKEDPPDTPDTGFLLDHGDSSEGGMGKGSTHLSFGERVTCMVPNLYFPTGLGRSTEALGIPISYENSRPYQFDSGLRNKLDVRQRLPDGYPSLEDCEDGHDDLDSPPERGGKRPRKNYKNMTRERRIEANARERTRVHTISAAFESLRRAVPSYSYNQKLSKLAILRIACTYIMALGRLTDIDYSIDGNKMDFPECVDLCTRTIQTEGRARRRH